MRVAIQGQKASFHDSAAHQWFGESIEVVPGETFREVFQAVLEGRADVLVTAIENSLYGSINEVYDLVELSHWPIIGEIKLPIHQQLIALPGTTLDTVTTVYSHPVALAQCEQYLNAKLPLAARIEQHDTAGSVEFIKQADDHHAARHREPCRERPTRACGH